MQWNFSFLKNIYFLEKLTEEKYVVITKISFLNLHFQTAE